jgi:hypothetical protein
MVGIALIDTRDFGFDWKLHPERTLDESLALLNRALVLDPSFSYGYYAKSVALMYALRLPEAVEAARTGTQVDPNSALSFAAMGRAEHPWTLRRVNCAHQGGLQVKSTRSAKGLLALGSGDGRLLSQAL